MRWRRRNLSKKPGWWHHKCEFFEPGQFSSRYVVPKLILLFSARGLSAQPSLKTLPRLSINHKFQPIKAETKMLWRTYTQWNLSTGDDWWRPIQTSDWMSSPDRKSWTEASLPLPSGKMMLTFMSPPSAPFWPPTLTGTNSDKMGATRIEEIRRRSPIILL